MSEDKRPTVRSIEWRVVTFDMRGVGLPERYVFAEDQELFPAGLYAEQVCEEHNAVKDHSEALEAYNYEHDRAEALRKALAALVAREGYSSTSGAFSCCGGFVGQGHEPECPWLAAKQLLEAVR